MSRKVNERRGSKQAAAPESSRAHRQPFIAYPVGDYPMQLVPAHPRRRWMDETPDRFAYRCVPLLLANQHGWFILNNEPLRARWSGGTDRASVVVERLAERAPSCPAASHFGSGILTFHIPYLFRTLPAFNLLVRGPANMPKDGIVGLDGLVETDWAVATFTMNWRFTRPDVWITFDQDEPICMLVPQRRGELEAFEPELQRLEDDPALKHAYEAWSMSRDLFIAERRLGLVDQTSGQWEKHYFRGTYPGGRTMASPQHRLAIRAFPSVPRRG